MHILFILLALCAFGMPAAAHDNGSSYEAVVEGYTVDVGYSTETPTTDDVVAFGFQLQKEGTDVSFSDAWVKIEDAHKAVVFAGGIHNAQYGGARMSYRFPEAGNYTMSVRYEAGDVRLAEAVIPMTVAEAPQEEPQHNWMLTGLIGVLLLGVAGGLVWRNRTSVSP